MAGVQSLDSVDRQKLQFIRHDNTISLYNDSKEPLYISTDRWTCPYGYNVDVSQKLVVIISDKQYFKIKELDEYGKDICKYYNGETYKPLSRQVDGLDVLELYLTSKTNLFDKYANKIEDDVKLEVLSNQFSAKFLLTFKLNVKENTFDWTIFINQIKIDSICQLPEGCKIFDSFEEILADDDNVDVDVDVDVDDEAVQNYDPDVNELI